MINFDVGGRHRQKLREQVGARYSVDIIEMPTREGIWGPFYLYLLNLMYDKFDTAATAAA